MVVFVRFPAPRGVAVVFGKGDARRAEVLPHGQRLAQRALLCAGHVHAVGLDVEPRAGVGGKADAHFQRVGGEERFRLGIGVGGDVAAEAQRQLFGFGCGQFHRGKRRLVGLRRLGRDGGKGRFVRGDGRVRRFARSGGGKFGVGGEVAVRRGLGPRLRGLRRLGRRREGRARRGALRRRGAGQGARRVRRRALRRRGAGQGVRRARRGALGCGAGEGALTARAKHCIRAHAAAQYGKRAHEHGHHRRGRGKALQAAAHERATAGAADALVNGVLDALRGGRERIVQVLHGSTSVESARFRAARP